MTGNKHVIHIKGSPRHDMMRKEMNSLYMGEYSVFNAIVDNNPKKGISESFKSIIEENYEEPFIHIFEDDVKFTAHNSREVFENGFQSLPDDWDLYLGGSYTYDTRSVEDLGVLLKIKNFRSLHCVVIRKPAYDAFLSHDVSRVENIDTWVSSQGLNVYLCNPQIAIQHQGYSYNMKRVVDYNRYLLDKNIHAG
jgi:hypothetical protein